MVIYCQIPFIYIYIYIYKSDKNNFKNYIYWDRLEINRDSTPLSAMGTLYNSLIKGSFRK